MKTSRLYWMVILSVIGLQIVQAQYAEDVLRFSQFSSAVGARSQAMGNTVVGIADDYSALFGNPAGLSQQKSFEFSVGLSRLGYENDVAYLGVKTTDDDDVINLNNLGIVYPIATSRGGLTFAFGFGRVANFTSISAFDAFNPSSSIIQSLTSNVNTYNYDDEAFDNFLDNSITYQLYLSNVFRDTINRDKGLIPLVNGRVSQQGTIQESGGLNNWSFGGGIDIAPNISFGLTLNFVTGSYYYDRVFNEIEPTQSLFYQEDEASRGYFSKFEWQSTFNSDISGFNAVFALMLRQPKYKLGLTVKTPTSYDISETFSDSYNSYFVNVPSLDPIIDDGTTEYKIKTPWVISGGFSFKPIDWLLLAGDAEYTDWTEMEFDSNNPDLIQENRNIIKLMQDTWNLRGGAEVSIWEIGLMLRAGIEWKPSPWKNDPPEYDQMMYTAGIGYLLDEGSSINLSYAIGSWDTFRNNYYLSNGMTSTTNESISTNTINITFSHKF